MNIMGCLFITQPTDMTTIYRVFYSRYSKFIFLSSHHLISLSFVRYVFIFIVHNASGSSSHELLLPFLSSLALDQSYR